ncbi:MAG: PAS domain-containing protein [Candidatus Hadarchaeia archaeon]
MKILLVDDNKTLLDQAKLFLEREDECLEVDTVSSPQKALELVEKGDYSAVISDYQMPEMNGLELIQSIKKKKDKRIPFIIFTGKGREEVAMKAVNIGVDHYIQKGGDPKSQYTVLANMIKKCGERYQSKRELRESERRYKTVFENTGSGTLILEDDGRISMVNKRAIDLIGLEKDEVVGERWQDLLKEEDVKALSKLFRLARENRNSRSIENEVSFLDENGEERYFLLSVSAIPDSSKLVISFIDITERKKAERELKKEKNLLNSMFENFPASIYVKNEAGEHIKVSSKLRENLEKRGIDKIIGKTDREIYSKVGGSFDEDFKIMETEEPVIRDLRYNQSNDSYYLTSKAPYYDSDGNVAGIVGMTLDVTEREKAKQKLERESHLLNSLLENIPDSVYFKDSENRFIRVSRAKAKHIGVSPENVKGKKDLDFYPEEEAKKMMEDDKRVMETGDSIRKRERVTRHNGEKVLVSVRKVPMYKDGDIVGTLGISREINEYNSKN